MAANVIRGLTVEIGGDTTKLGKALEDVNKKSQSLTSELGEINRLLKMDPGNADLLAQKQKVLAEAVSNTAKKLETLKEAERQVQQQFERGEVSEEQVRALQREIVATTNKLKGYENAVRETAEAVDKLGDEAEDAGNEVEGAARDLDRFADAADDIEDSLDGAGGAFGSFLGNFASDTLQNAIGFLKDAVESSREYRTEMGKLNVAFTDNGHSAESAKAAYQELQGVLGETEQAVEAANHLAKLTDNEKDLATWTGDILPGVFATFGASLPIEGLTEAANETAKVGQVTGPLADALNWAGISEDAFNESLAKCTSEQERQKLIMETLAGVYGEASAAYKETNADVIAANQANEAWQASLAQVGAAVEPLITQVKEIAAELLTKLVPVIEGLLNNLPTIAVALAGITAALVSYKVAAIAATAAEKGMTLAQYAAAAAQKALNVAMASNPIGLIIVAITALVAAFVHLWNNSESFRNFWIKLWEKIKSAALKAVESLKQMPAKIYNALKSAITRVQEWGTNLVNKVKTAATNMLTSAVNTLKNLPGRVYSAISGAIQKVVAWGTNMVNKAKAAMSKVVNSVYDTLKGLPKKVLSIGSDLVTGLWNGVNNKLTWLKNKIKGFTSSVLDSIKSFFGVNSPSKETAWIGDMLDQGLADGVLDNAKDPIKAMQRVSGGVLDAAAGGVNGLSLSRQLSRPSVASVAPAASEGGLGAKLDKILAAIEHGQVIAIDGDALVGATASKMDTVLGRRRALAARGAT